MTSFSFGYNISEEDGLSLSLPYDMAYPADLQGILPFTLFSQLQETIEDW